MGTSLEEIKESFYAFKAEVLFDRLMENLENRQYRFQKCGVTAKREFGITTFEEDYINPVVVTKINELASKRSNGREYSVVAYFNQGEDDKPATVTYIMEGITKERDTKKPYTKNTNSSN